MPARRVRPLDGLSFTARDGELVVVKAPSGGGKTTLLCVLAGLLSPAADGHVRLDGRHGAVRPRPARAPPPNRGHGVPVVQPRREPHGGSRTSRRLSCSPGCAAAPLGRGRSPRSSASGSPIAPDSGPDACRADSSSGSPSPAPSCASRRCCWPTSRPRTSMRRTPTPSCGCCGSSCRPGRLVVVATHDDRFLEVADRLVHPSLARRPPDVGVPARGTPLVGALALARAAPRAEPLGCGWRSGRGGGGRALLLPRPGTRRPTARDSSRRRTASSERSRSGRTGDGWCRRT